MLPSTSHSMTTQIGSRWRALAGMLGALLLLSLAGCTLPRATISLGGGTTATPGPSPTPGVIYQSSLMTGEDGWANDHTNCGFGGDGYHIKANYVCFAPAGSLTNLDLSVRVKRISGSALSTYGIAFRRESQGNFYEFDIDGAGEWVFFKCVSSDCTPVIKYTANAAIHGEINTENTLDVQARGPDFDFFVNGVPVGQAHDTTYDVGKVGLTGSDNTEVVFTNILVIQPSLLAHPSPSAQPSPTA
jgi:hypothetical protein